MSFDPRVIDLADRIDKMDRKVERLESLEYGTTAFPSGGAGAICDIIVPSGPPISSVTCPIPPGNRHLMAIIGAGNNRIGSILFTTKIRVTINALVAGYGYETRQEKIFVVGDSDAVALAGAAFWETISISLGNALCSLCKQMDSGLFIFPDPDLMVGAEADVAPGAAWIGGGRFRSTAPLVVGIAEETSQGGGFNNTFPVAPITSITWTAFPPELFWPGSRFTVYGL